MHMHSIIAPLQEDGREKLIRIPGMAEDWLLPCEQEKTLDPFYKGGGDKEGAGDKEGVEDKDGGNCDIGRDHCGCWEDCANRTGTVDWGASDDVDAIRVEFWNIHTP